MTLPIAAEFASRELRVLQSLRRIIRAVDLHSRRLVSTHEITLPQLVCLRAVETGQPITAAAVARAVHLSPSTVIGIVDRLEKRGLIRRERQTGDRRRIHLTLTEPGAALVRRLPVPLQDRLTGAMAALPVAEQETIARSLERVVELLEAREIEAAPILGTGPIGE